MIDVLDMPGREKRPTLERMVFRGVVFNMSWEDPEMDRRAFQLTDDDVVVSISSAGCNPLNFLYQGPQQVYSVDSNPAQNAILELKLAGIRALDYQTFYDIFASRRPEVVTRHYHQRLRPLLSQQSRDFWDRKLWIVARNLYDYGRMGMFCRLLRWYLNRAGIPQRRIEQFLDLPTLEAQRQWYHRYAAPRLWGPATRALLNFRPFLYMAGVHPTQFKLVDGRHDIYDYVKERVEYALTQVPIYNNYFMAVALSGRFRGGRRVPPYLFEENFDALRRNVDRIQVINGWLGPFLDSLPPQSVSKFNLLDIFDWMTPEIFESTLQSVLRAARPGATMIYRSGSYRLDPPESIRPHLRHHADLSRELLAIDRSATYGSFYVFTINPGSNGQAAQHAATAAMQSA